MVDSSEALAQAHVFNQGTQEAMVPTIPTPSWDADIATKPSLRSENYRQGTARDSHSSIFLIGCYTA